MGVRNSHGDSHPVRGHDKAVSVPRGGALARSKRLAGSFARLAACKRRGDEEWNALGLGHDQSRRPRRDA